MGTEVLGDTLWGRISIALTQTMWDKRPTGNNVVVQDESRSTPRRYTVRWDESRTNSYPMRLESNRKTPCAAEWEWDKKKV